MPSFNELTINYKISKIVQKFALISKIEAIIHLIEMNAIFFNFYIKTTSFA
jgi:hypothetical protein